MRGHPAVIALGVTGALALAAAGCGGNDNGGSSSGGGGSSKSSSGGATQAKALTLNLSAVKGSGETAKATLTPVGNKTRVTINAQGLTANDQASHIHTQTCANPNPQPAYPLNNVKNGKASTLINVPLTKLEAGQFYVNIHKSAKDFTVVSCADIPNSGAAASAGAQAKAMTLNLAAVKGSGETAKATLTPLGNKTRVTINAKNVTAGSQASHIHTQTCANPNPQPAFPLNNVKNGKASTVINVPLSRLEAGQFYVNIHKSAKDFTVVSCADIPNS
jgi:Cu/Zn superoxide dismutase